MEETHIALMGCEVAKSPDLMNILSTPSNVVLGWTEAVYSPNAYDAITKYYTEIDKTGRVSEKVYEKLKADGDHQYSNEEGILVTMVRTSPVNDLRLRETITVFNPDTAGLEDEDKLMDGMLIPIVGAPDDGAADTMKFRILVDGIEDDEAFKYNLNIYVDGIKLPTTFNLASAGKVGDYRYEFFEEVDLGFDVQRDAKSYEVEFRVELPEGGYSFQTLMLGLTAGTWTMTVAGAEVSGVFSGDVARLYANSGLLQLSRRTVTERPGVSMDTDFDFPPQSGPFTTALGMTTSGGSRSNINFFYGEVGTPSRRIIELRNGDGGTEQIAGGLSSYTFPESPLLTLDYDNILDTQITGSVSGTYFTYDVTQTDLYPVSITFNAINCSDRNAPGCKN